MQKNETHPQKFVHMFIDENGEAVHNCVMVAQDELLGDPASVLDRRLDVEERMEDFAKAVQLLPPRQLRSLLCSVTERVDDIISFKKVMAFYHIDEEMFVWPDDEADKKLLKASLQPARRNIAHFMGITFPRK